MPPHELEDGSKEPIIELEEPSNEQQSSSMELNVEDRFIYATSPQHPVLSDDEEMEVGSPPPTVRDDEDDEEEVSEEHEQNSNEVALQL